MSESITHASDGGVSALARILLPALLFIGIVVFYLPSVSGDFVYDDRSLVLNQKQIRKPADLLTPFGERYTANMPYYRPLSRLTFSIQFFFARATPWPYHLFNILTMGLAALTLYFFLLLPPFQIGRLSAFLGAALAAIHPVASSVVYPISGREALLSTLFVILALSAFIRRGRRAYLAAMFFFFTALLFREHAIIVPILFVAADILGLSQDAPGKRIVRWLKRHLPVVLLLLVYLSIRMAILGAGEGHRPAIFDAPLGLLHSFAYLPQTLICPFFNLVYEPPLEVWWSTGRVLLCSGVLIAAIAAALFMTTPAARRGVFFWFIWLVAGMLPTANIFIQETPFAERHLFMSLIGFAGAGSAMVSAFRLSRFHRGILFVICLFFICHAAATTFHRRIYFQNDRIFYEQWMKTNPKASQPQWGLGDYFLRKGDTANALRHLEQAARLNPDDPKAQNSLGILFGAQGDFDRAEFHLRQAHRLNPDDPHVCNNLGSLYDRMGRPDRAVEWFRRSLDLRPDNVIACNNLGQMLERMGEVEAALVYYRRALRLDPSHADAIRNVKRLEGRRRSQ